MKAHIWSAYTAASRVRERGAATHNAGGATATAAVLTAAGSRSRRRASGSARPAATAVHASARSGFPRNDLGERLPPRLNRPPLTGRRV